MSKTGDRKIATVQAVAQLAGYSVPAVYQALNSSGTLSQTARKRILAAARELGFAPNTAAIAVSRGKFGGIAILSSAERGRPLPSGRALYAIQEEAHRRDLHVSMTTLADRQLAEESLPKLLRELSVDGFLVNIILPIPHLAPLIEKHRLPSVWMNVVRESDCIYIDDAEAVGRGTRHLLSLGHKRVAYTITAGHAADVTHYSVAAREAGYLAAMAEAGFEPIVLKPDRDLDPADRAAFVRSWLDDPPGVRPTAVIAYERADGLAVLWQAMRMGIDVPGDLSVMHVTEEPDAWLGFEMSRLRIPQYEIGHKAVELLCRKIESPGEPIPPQRILLDLVEGATIGPARG